MFRNAIMTFESNIKVKYTLNQTRWIVMHILFHSLTETFIFDIMFARVVLMKRLLFGSKNGLWDKSQGLND